MSITIDPNAQAAQKNAQDMDNEYFLLKALGLLDPDDPMNDPNVTVTIEQATMMVGRTEGDNISYGNSIEINAENLDQLGLGDDIITYHMDQNGNLDLNELSDNTENNPEGFLLNMDRDISGWKYDPSSDEYTITRMQGNENPAFTIQPVEVDGMLQGYFVQGVTESGSQTGLYLDASAVDLSGMDENMKAELFADPPAQDGMPQDQTLVAESNLDQTSDQTMGMKL